MQNGNSIIAPCSHSAARSEKTSGATAEKESRICVISILVSDLKSAEQINAALSAYSEYIIGRMGVPYKAKNVSVLSVALDAPVEVTNALTGKIGKLNGVYVKALFGKI